VFGVPLEAHDPGLAEAEILSEEITKKAAGRVGSATLA